jgi:hypothetical protein
MDILPDSSFSTSRKTFLSHVFSTTEDGKSEIMNVVQYALLGVIPVVLLNKAIQRFIPDADMDKSSIEILLEILIQLVVMFVGIVLIHRVITYIPTYSEHNYDPLNLTTVVLAFLILVLSIQTKMGIKVNILVERVMELWNGPDMSPKAKSHVRVRETMTSHIPSQADYLDGAGGQQSGIFPPAPIATTPQSRGGYDMMMNSSSSHIEPMVAPGPAPANAMLGSSFGSF